MKKISSKKLVVGMLIYTFVISLFAGESVNTNAAVMPKKIIMNNSKINLNVGQKIGLKVKKIKPFKANQAVKYMSTNKKIAKVNKKGIVTGISKGKCIIKVISKINKKVSTKVKVVVRKKQQVIQNSTATPTIPNTQVPATKSPGFEIEPTLKPSLSPIVTAVVRPTGKPTPINSATKTPSITARPEPPAPVIPPTDGKGEWIKINLDGANTDTGFGGSIKKTEYNSIVLSGTTDHVMFPISDTYDATQIIEVYITGISYSTDGQVFRVWSGGRNLARTSEVANNQKAENNKQFSVQVTLKPMASPEKATFNSITIASNVSGTLFKDMEITSAYYRIDTSLNEGSATKEPTAPPTVTPAVTPTEPSAPATPPVDEKGEWIEVNLNGANTDAGFGGSIKKTEYNSVVLSGTTDHVMFPISDTYDATQIIEVYVTGISYSTDGQIFRVWSGGRNKARTSEVANNQKAEYNKQFSIQVTLNPMASPEKETFDSITIASNSSGKYFKDLEITSVYYRVIQ